jgi:cell division protein FtsZ
MPSPQPAQAASAPQAPPHGASFIAPRPVEPTREPQVVRNDLRPLAESVATAAASVPQQQPEKRDERRRGPSLFERVTGTGRARELRQQQAAAAAAAPAPVPAPVQPPLVPAPAPAPAPAAAQPGAPAQQPRLGGLDPTERIPTSRQEEDLLDIPAFLRRQAN